MKILSKIGFTILLFCCIAFINDNKKTKVFLVGDSTMSVKARGSYPETGWGMPFEVFFDSSVVVENLAQNGRSTKSFIAEKRWDYVVENAREGDFVFIQFGHNDEVKEKKNATSPEEFTANLTRFVNDTRAKKAIPILLTSVARRKFDDAGKLVDTHQAYAALVKQLAIEMKVAFIDHNAKSMQLLQELGPEKSVFLYNHLAPGEHPNYPAGVEDNTHFNELGARRMAELVLAEIKAQQMPLAQKIVVKPVKK